MILSPSVSQTIVLVLLMAAGFAAGKMKVLDATTGKGLSKLLVDFVLPAMILESMQKPFDPALRDLAFRVLGVSLAAYAAAMPLAVILFRALGVKGAARGPYFVGAVFSNCAFMGFPVVEALLGRDAIFFASIANIPFQLLAFSLGAHALASAAGRPARLGWRACVPPAAGAAVLGFAFFLRGLAFPDPLLRAFRTLGDMTTPLSMALIGSILSRMDWKKAAGDWRLYALSAYRLAIFPALLFAILAAAGATGILLALPVILAAMPVAANTAILAEAYGGDAETGSSLVLVSTFLSVGTIPLLAFLVPGS
ncbi:MAG: AEC family transporter [Spirochaetaceae bacterium]|nr:AEC family transporter [Spirochaetaceae bacterium]